jgi:hypothetical protein
MGCRIFILPALQELEELLCASFLEKPHQRTLDGLHLGTGHLGDLSIPIDITSGDLLEFQISSDIGVDQNLGEFPRGDDEFGNQINVIVAIPSQLCRWFSTVPELAPELVGDIRRQAWR